MKHFLLLSLFLTGISFLTGSCRQKQPANPFAQSPTIETPITNDGLPKATAIAWVDYNKEKKWSFVRTVKAHVHVDKYGKITILEFTKKQPVILENYLRKCLKVYRVPQPLLEGNYIKPGKQYMQLRYVPEWIK